MRRRCFITVTLGSIGGCLGRGSSGGAEEEINHKENDSEYLGTHESHQIGFETIDYARDANQDKVFVDFGNEPPAKAAVRVFFYHNGNLVGAGSQFIDRYPFNDRDSEHILLPPRGDMKEFTGYRIAVLKEKERETEDPNIGPQPGQGPRDYCEDENVDPEEDEPMAPNCNENPYDGGSGSYKSQYLRPIEGYDTIRK